MKNRIIPLLLVASTFTLNAAELNLTDGRTFNGWVGDTNKTWRMEDGAFVGGTLERKVPQNEFLRTTRSFTNFVLKVKFKLVGTDAGGFINGRGILTSGSCPSFALF